MDKLVAMRTFVEIVDRGGLTRAAEALERSTPTVVRVLADLERSLGAKLLNRTTRRMSLTEEGAVYLERCRQILLDVEDAEGLLTARQQVPQGRLTVTAPVLFGQRHVAPALTQFIVEHPRIAVQLLLLDRTTNLVDEGIDLAVRIGHLGDSTLFAARVGTMRRVVCASPLFLKRIVRPSCPDDLAQHPCLVVTALGRSTWRFRDGERVNRVTVTGRFEVNQASAAVDACVAGLGFGSFMAYQVAAEVVAGRLEVVLSEFEMEPVPVSLLYAGGRLMSPRLRAAIEWLRPQLSTAVERTNVLRSIPTHSAHFAGIDRAPTAAEL